MSTIVKTLTHEVTGDKIAPRTYASAVKYDNTNVEDVIDGVLNGNTVTSPNADFAEVGEWSDGNPNNEDRVGYFVSVDNTTAGITMVKATSTSDIRGVTMETPAFAANASADKYDSSRNLLKQYDYVGFAGFIPVRDDGTCVVNGRCISNNSGIAVPSTNNLGYQVIERISTNKILILVEPSADLIQKIKTDVTGKQDTLSWVTNTDIDAMFAGTYSAT